MWASAQNISGAGWSGMAEATSLDTMTQMNQAFRNIVNMLHGVGVGGLGGAGSGPAMGMGGVGGLGGAGSGPAMGMGGVGGLGGAGSGPAMGMHPVQHVHDVAKRLIHLGHGV